MGHMYKKGKNMLFSIVIVSLNPGDKLKKTVDSVIQQSCQDVQILVKDGMSRTALWKPWKRSMGDILSWRL